MPSANQPILITGCQRSGTTLLHLILDSHSNIHGIDEAYYEHERLHEYLDSAEFSKYVCFKLPRAASEFEFIKLLPDVKVLWCIRDPRDVVLSMINLRLPLTPSRMLVSWPAHPWGGIYDISSSYAALDEDSQRTLASDFNIYKKIARKSPHVITREELVFLGALCWRLKNDLLKIYRENNIDHKIIYYEQLIERPRKILEGLLPYIGAAWEENVLKHHEIHAGQSIGGTSNTRPIDKNNRGKWKRRLGANDISIIKKLCGKPANKLFRNYFS